MRQVIVLSGIAVVLGLAFGARAQSPQPVQHIVGDRIGGGWRIDGPNRMTRIRLC